MYKQFIIARKLNTMYDIHFPHEQCSTYFNVLLLVRFAIEFSCKALYHFEVPSRENQTEYMYQQCCETKHVEQDM